MVRLLWVGLASGAMLILGFAGNLWFSPSGTGEYRRSPDGRFTAHAFNMTRGTFISGRVAYIELLVIESTSEREIWRTHYFHHADDVPSYGDRSQAPFIRWAADSSSVVIPVGGGRQITIPLP